MERSRRMQAESDKGAATKSMAILRNVVVYLFKRLGHKSPVESLQVLLSPIREGNGPVPGLTLS